MNRKEGRLLSPALPSTEEGREQGAGSGGSMRECFRGNLSSIGWRHPKEMLTDSKYGKTVTFF